MPDTRDVRLIVTFSDGSVKPAFAPIINGRFVRAFVPGCEDAVEFKWTRGRWLDEGGHKVAIQFDVAHDEFHSLLWNLVESGDPSSNDLQFHLMSLFPSTGLACGRVN